MAGIIQDEAVLDTKRGFTGGFEMETISLGLPFTAAFLNPGAWGADYTNVLEQYPNMAAMWIVGEDMPQEKNAITLHPTEKDKFGLPIPNVHYDDHTNDLAMRTYAYKKGAAVYQAVGATQTIEVPPYPSTHNLGTCRQSEKPGDGVCNKWGQTHDLKNLFISDGSQFTTSAAENPTLTIVTLAIRQADYIGEQCAKQNI
jgi:choline dehydrogenase-like flavoprotein